MRHGLFIAALLAANGVQAACFGSGNLYNCYDNQGNSYMVNKMGNMTTVNGYNSNTGSSWNQMSTTVGNTTFQNGTSSDGGNWNQTIQNMGTVRTYSGQDSDGNTFYRSCTNYGCY